MAGPTGGGGQVGNIVVRVTGDSRQYQQSMKEASSATTTASNKISQDLKRVDDAVKKTAQTGSRAKQAMQAAGNSVAQLMPVASVAAFVGFALQARQESQAFLKSLEEIEMAGRKFGDIHRKNTQLIIQGAQLKGEGFEAQLAKDIDKATKSLEKFGDQYEREKKRYDSSFLAEFGRKFVGIFAPEYAGRDRKNLQQYAEMEAAARERLDQLNEAARQSKQQQEMSSIAAGKAMIEGLRGEIIALKDGAEAARLYQASLQNLSLMDTIRVAALGHQKKKLEDAKEATRKLAEEEKRRAEAMLQQVERIDAALFGSAEARSRIAQHNIAITQGIGKDRAGTPGLAPTPDMHPWGQLPIPHTDAARALEGAGIAENVLRAILAVLVERLPKDQVPVLPANFGGVNGN